MREEFYPYILLFLAAMITIPYWGTNNLSVTGLAVSKPVNSLAEENVYDSGLVTSEITVNYRDGTVYVHVSGDQIYNTGYYFDYNSESWSPFYFSDGEGFSRDSADTQFNPTGLRKGINSLIIYSCSLTDSGNKCGCVSETDCGHWQNVKFFA